MNAILEIPIRLDIFSIFILLGVIQGLFLFSFFLLKKWETSVSNKLLGLILLGMAAINFEIFLCYSRYIVKLIHLVDFSEPFNLMGAPAFYLFLRFKTSTAEKMNPRQILHFLPFVFYTLYCILFFIQTAEFKYNAFLSAYFPGKSHTPSVRIINPDPLFLKKFINEISLVQFFIYLGMGFFVIYKAFKKRGLPLFANINSVLKWLRNFTLFILIFFIFNVFVRITFKEDLGDHLLASFFSIIIYSISYTLIVKPLFFRKNAFSQEKKYEKSSLSGEMKDRILKKLYQVMEEEKPFLDSFFSLPSLAKKVQTSPHHLSQVLNDCLKKNFYEYTAEYRIKEAKRILLNPKYNHIMLEEIAEEVGYNSKSAFNLAFKKQTGLNPSQFREQNKKK